MTDYIVPVLLLLVCGLALRKKEDPYQLMLTGAADGLRLLLSLVPTLILLMTAVTMLRASGATEAISRWMAPAFWLWLYQIISIINSCNMNTTYSMSL